jgi:hypothetical protein
VNNLRDLIDNDPRFHVAFLSILCDIAIEKFATADGITAEQACEVLRPIAAKRLAELVRDYYVENSVP